MYPSPLLYFSILTTQQQRESHNPFHTTWDTSAHFTRHTELTLLLCSLGLSPLAGPAQEAYHLNYLSCSNKTLLLHLSKMQFSNIPCLALIKAQRKGRAVSVHQQKIKSLFSPKQFQFCLLFIIYTCPSSLLNVQNLTSKSSNLSKDPSLQAEPRNMGEGRHSPKYKIPADTDWGRKYSFYSAPGNAARKYRALPNAGLSQPKITAIHVFTQLPLEKLTQKCSRRPAPAPRASASPQTWIKVKPLSPWTVGDKQKPCNGSRALLHPPCLHKARQGDKARSPNLSQICNHCCLTSVSGPMAETFPSRSLGPLTAFCC